MLDPVEIIDSLIWAFPRQVTVEEYWAVAVLSDAGHYLLMQKEAQTFAPQNVLGDNQDV